MNNSEKNKIYSKISDNIILFLKNNNLTMNDDIYDIFNIVIEDIYETAYRKYLGK